MKCNRNIYLSLLLAFLITGLIVSCQQNQNEKHTANTIEDAAVKATADSIVLEQVWELNEQIRRPESAVYEPGQNIVYISNMVGGASDKDGEGYISKITPEGEMQDPRWVGGLHAPKGLAIHGDYLYAADIDALVKIDLETGEVAQRYPADKAKFLNDVTADTAGNVYVSDSRISAVYRLKGDTFDIWLQGDSIRSPNGVYAEADRLVIAAGRKGAGEGRLMQSIDYDSHQVMPMGKGEPIGELDAVQPNGRGGYFLSDWGAGEVMSYHPETGVQILKTISQGTADLDYIEEQELVVLPVMMSDRILGFRVE